MPKFLLFLLMILVLVSPVIAPAEVVTFHNIYGEEVGWYNASYALVIATYDYADSNWTNLPHLETEALSVKSALEERGFGVLYVDNPTRTELDQALAEFRQIYAQQKQSRLVIYYAGHAHNLGEMGYLVPSDAPHPQTDQTDFLSRALEVRQLEFYAEQLPAKHALFLIDADLSLESLNLAPSHRNFLSYQTNEPVRQIIVSGSDHEESLFRGILPEYFVRAITGHADQIGRDGYVTGSELGEYLQKKVRQYSNKNYQLVYGKMTNQTAGDVVFTGRPSLTYVLANDQAEQRQEFYMTLSKYMMTDPFGWRLMTRQYLEQPLVPLDTEDVEGKTDKTGKSLFGDEFEF